MREIEKIVNVFKRVHDKLLYRSDESTQGQQEHWKDWSLGINFADGKKIFDDCEGYAVLFAAELVKEGIAKENIGISFCQITDPEQRGEWGGHLVCVVKDAEAGYWYVMDNNIHRPHKIAEYPFPIRWHSFMMLDNPGPKNWFANIPWED